MKNITVIGGGTGSFTVLTGLKKHSGIKLSAIVPSTDSGGSTGKLRDEFGYLPMGDIRQCLVALAENEEEQFLLRELFQYRFSKGENSLQGHNFGNLFLTALTDIFNGDQIKAIKKVQELLNIKGNVYPITLNNCHLVAEYENGEIVIGEHNIDEPSYPHDGRLRIKNLYTEPKSQTYKEVKNCIKKSDLIVIGPGDLYTSIVANLAIDAVPKLIREAEAKVVYILNLVTKFGQTYDFKASDFVNEIVKYLGKMPDYILVNNTSLPSDILKRYTLENAKVVENDLKLPNVILDDFLASEEIKTVQGDILKRSLIRHDGDKVARTLVNLLALS